MKIKARWYVGCSNDVEKAARKLTVLSASPTLDILKSVIEKRIADTESVQESATTYESPSWAYIQADRIGALRELKELHSLLTIEKD